MGRVWCLLLFPLLLLQHQVSSEVCASRCGKITNISHPFRLRDDPPECGDRRYELGCDNNVTVLRLFSGTYNVLGINYDNQIIQVVDAGIREGDCSSLPRKSLYLYNFSYPHDMWSDRDPYRAVDGSVNMFEHIIYLNCSDPVVRDHDDHIKYVDTSPCVNWESKGHVYAVVGDFGVGNLTDQCQVKLVATITKNWGSFLHKKNYSYADIHSLLSYGFELSWSPGLCSSLPCPLDGRCLVTYDPEKRECTTEQYPGSKLLLVSSDFAEGLINGLLQIKGSKTDTNYTDFYQWEPFVRAMGVVTGRFLLPYRTALSLLGSTLLFVWLIYRCSRRHVSMDENIELFLQNNDLMPIRYSYNEIRKMTGGFKDRLGEGGFGTVYKGKLTSGPHVAVKLLGKSKANGLDFINEVATIGRIHHVHIVQLIGFCVQGSTCALVYEFMPNGSLDKYIFSKEETVSLSYDRIYDISLGVARGIAYLHHGCDQKILHFDIKPHNILLDDNFIPKISDFGLAKLYPVDDSIVKLTAAKGTIGYMAPELFYRNIGGVSYKADVYSFGMLLMEMASKRRNTSQRSTEHSSQYYFPLWIYDQFTEEKTIEMEHLTEEENNIVKKMLIVSWWCIQLKPSDRPSMNKVIEMLEADVESLEIPPRPLLYPTDMGPENQEFNSYQTSSSGYTYSTSSAGDGIPDSKASNGVK